MPEGMDPLKVPDMNILGLTPPTFNMKCEEGYLQTIEHFGFLYLLDHTSSTFSHPINQCKQVDPGMYGDQKVPKSEKSNQKFDIMAMQPQFQPNATVFNIDNQCNIDNLFSKKEFKAAFHQHFAENCFMKSECSFDSEKIKFSEMVSPVCLDRIYNK